ncbi:unnamed protein product, partial [Linum tenue]
LPFPIVHASIHSRPSESGDSSAGRRPPAVRTASTTRLLRQPHRPSSPPALASPPLPDNQPLVFDSSAARAEPEPVSSVSLKSALGFRFLIPPEKKRRRELEGNIQLQKQGRGGFLLDRSPYLKRKVELGGGANSR